jgi:hypothetical protein
MVAGTINADATLIPDQAEVWVALKSAVTDITTLIPSSVTADLAGLGWEHTGLVDDKKGIPLDPSIEVKEYDGFGHPKFRTKLRNGKLNTGFTALEINSVTRKLVLPGSPPKGRAGVRAVPLRRRGPVNRVGPTASGGAGTEGTRRLRRR